MLSDNPIFPTIPTTDIKKAKEFYQDKLGLKIIYERNGEILFEAGNKSRVYVYERPPSPTDHTLASFYVDDIYETVEKLKGNGVEFMEYDLPGIKTDENNVATKGAQKAAWFKNPDGNILALSQVK